MHLDPRTPSSVKKVLSLANKYGMDQFRLRIVQHIQLDWPQSLWQWDKLEAQITSMRTAWGKGPNGEPDFQRLYLDDNLPEPASAIRLARECDIPAVLPAAFYHLSRLSIYDDWCETRQFLGTDPMHCEGLDSGRRTAEWGLLTAEDFVCLLKGQAKLSVAAGEMLHFGHSGREEHEHDCPQSKQFEIFQKIRETCHHSTDILRATRVLMEGVGIGEEMCLLCHSYIRQELASFRQRLWMKLPDFFGLQ
jgi:hypothetical protein